MKETTLDIGKLVADLYVSAREGLKLSYRQRAELPGSPWFAYLGSFGGVLIARTDNPEDPIPEGWRMICKVNNARTDDANLRAINDALQRFDFSGVKV